MLVENPKRVNYLISLPPPKLLAEVTRAREIFSRAESVPVGKIVIEGMIIDEQHAKDLGAMMTGKWKQPDPISLRCREGGMAANDVLFDVLDGFHRVRGAQIFNISELFSTVRYNMTDEEMFDHRIIAANSVKSVKFARLAYWIRGAWAQTPWRSKISVTQAFGLATFDSSGKILGLSAREVEDITRWVNDKAEKWLSPPGTLYQDLLLIDQANQELVMRVRTGSFIAGGLALTKPQFQIIVKTFPREDRTQLRIAELATGHSLSTQELNAFVQELKVNSGGLNEQNISQVFIDGNWRKGYLQQSDATTVSSFSPQQVERTLKLAKRKTKYSSLPLAVIKAISEGIGNLETLLHPFTDSKVPKAEASFLERWVTLEFAKNLRTNPEYIQTLTQEFSKLDEAELYYVAKELIKIASSDEIDNVDIAIEVFKPLPLNRFKSKYAHELVDDLITRIVNLRSGEYQAEDIGAFLTTATELYERFSVVLNSQELFAAWSKLLDELGNTATVADKGSRIYIIEWIKKQKKKIKQ